jgi:hypothetical protein
MEMSHHQFCLKWNNHSSNLLKVFGRLFSNESFTDVTLAAEGRSIRAHKVKCSSSSSSFNIPRVFFFFFFYPPLLF